MSKSGPTPPIVEPMQPEAVDGYVEVFDPPESKLKMTADAAEISGIRMLAAASEAREPSHGFGGDGPSSPIIP